ncbi:hypothetical protein CEXT_808831 [Caerostris extrusa]|uniref:Uncharacterized protein n=1 Tax=Caerostris extrusa TaxID=172846 RepID=A0AAV4WYY6_CAEEX|nr:hypothetical protein CEXT_808831 [Caerostris extrusa]
MEERMYTARRFPLQEVEDVVIAECVNLKTNLLVFGEQQWSHSPMKSQLFKLPGNSFRTCLEAIGYYSLTSSITIDLRTSIVEDRLVLSRQRGSEILMTYNPSHFSRKIEDRKPNVFRLHQQHYLPRSVLHVSPPRNASGNMLMRSSIKFINTPRKIRHQRLRNIGCRKAYADH